MSFNVAVVVAIVIIVTSLIALAIIIAARQHAAREEELKQAASARGWRFESSSEKGWRVHRWSGTTDGVPWIAESITRVSGGSHAKHRTFIGRWHGTFSPGINAPIAVMGVPKGKEMTATDVATGDSWVAKMAQKAVGFAFDKAVDVYFGDVIGKEVDAGAMHRIDKQKIPGFIVMAADKDEGERILTQGFEKALVDASNDPASIMAKDDRPWILLRPHAVSLARMQRLRDTAELESFVRTGVALTRVFKFGRIGGS